jgi:hypothetical protein
VVPSGEITLRPAEGGVVSVVNPTSPADVELPALRVQLEVPARVQQALFK